MIYRHIEEEIQYYFTAPALNQSSIKVILKDGIQKFIEQEEELISKEDLYYSEEKHFIIGNGVDCIISHGMEIFKKNYAYSTLINKPSDTVMSIVKLVFDKIPPGEKKMENIKFYSKQLYDSCNEHNYYMSRKIPSDKDVKTKIVDENGNKKEIIGPDKRTWKDDKRVDSFLVDGTVAQYWKELIDSQGKQLLSEFEKEKISSISESLLTHKHTKHIFECKEGFDIVYQMPLFFNVDGVLCKGLLDMVKIDHLRKKVLIIDIKTTGDYVLRFNQSLRIRRYDIQGSFYLRAVKQNLKIIGELVGKDISSYTVANPAFVVESTLKAGTPMIYVMTDSLVNTGIMGSSTRGYIQGYVQGISLFKEWKSINYSLEERFKNTNGIVWIDEEFEYTEQF